MKDKLMKIKKLLQQTYQELNELPCECDNYNGFVCKLHNWRNRTLELVTDINEAVEGVDDES